MKTLGIIDKGLTKLFSRKLLVFTIASIALFGGTIDSGDFTIISVIYMSAQAAEDIFLNIIKINNKNEY